MKRTVQDVSASKERGPGQSGLLKAEDHLQAVLLHCNGKALAMTAMVCRKLRDEADVAARQVCLARGIHRKSTWCSLKKASWAQQLHRAEKGANAWRSSDGHLPLSVGRASER
jgi:hypothetical protein